MFQSEFDGFCPLYGTANCSGVEANETSVISCSFVAGRSSVCSFITMSNVLASVLYALGCFGYLAYLVNRSRVMIRVAYVIFFFCLYTYLVVLLLLCFYIGSRPSVHYFRSVCLSVCLSVCMSVCLFLQSFSQPSLIRFRCLGLVVSPRI